MTRRYPLHALAALALLAPATMSARADLADYVKKPEPAFAWKEVPNKFGDAAAALGLKVHTLEMTSQVWQGITWKHELLIVLPANSKPTDTVFLWNQGGKISEGTALFAGTLAGKIKAPVVFLHGIPNQPLLGDRREDALIAETFVRYLKTRDASWPLLFPMVKSLVKAMDAVQEFAKKEYKTEVKSFVVTGASKRGWTTWLTGASDPRVKAIMPLVIDTVNMQKQLPYQLESYGRYSEMIKDYTGRKLVPMPDTPDAKKLWSMVDPWIYRDRLKMPKMIVNGANDPYWTQDALNLYWDGLTGPKWVCYVPNAGHNLQQKKGDSKGDLTRAVNILSAFGRSQIHNLPLPKQAWKHSDGGDGKFVLTVSSDQAPKAARLWTADAKTRDFRKSEWTSRELKVSDGHAATAAVEAPASGCRAFFAEYEYDMKGLRYQLSTQIRIVGKPVAEEKKK